jgi:hypothetical protein
VGLGVEVLSGGGKKNSGGEKEEGVRFAPPAARQGSFLCVNTGRREPEQKGRRGPPILWQRPKAPLPPIKGGAGRLGSKIRSSKTPIKMIGGAILRAAGSK